MYVTWPLVDSVIHTVDFGLSISYKFSQKKLHLEITLRHFSAGHAEFRTLNC